MLHPSKERPQCVILHSVCDLGCFVKYQVCKQYIIVFVISFYHHNLSLELIEANLFCQVLLAGYDRRLQVFFISHLSNFVGNCSNVSQIVHIDCQITREHSERKLTSTLEHLVEAVLFACQFSYA